MDERTTGSGATSGMTSSVGTLAGGPTPTFTVGALGEVPTSAAAAEAMRRTMSAIVRAGAVAVLGSREASA